MIAPANSSRKFCSANFKKHCRRKFVPSKRSREFPPWPARPAQISPREFFSGALSKVCAGSTGWPTNGGCGIPDDRHAHRHSHHRHARGNFRLHRFTAAPRPRAGGVVAGVRAHAGSGSPCGFLFEGAGALGQKNCAKYFLSWRRRAANRLAANWLSRLHPRGAEKIKRNSAGHRSRSGHGTRLRHQRGFFRLSERRHRAWQYADDCRRQSGAAIFLFVAGGEAGRFHAAAHRRRGVHQPLHAGHRRETGAPNVDFAERGGRQFF